MADGAGAYLVWDAAFAELAYDGPVLPDPGERYDLLQPRLAQARHNLELLLSWANRHSEFVSIVRPQGGVCVFMRMHGVADSEDFCRQLADEYGVLLVPGTSFGNPNHVRLGFGCSTTELTEGLAPVCTLSHLSRFETNISSSYLSALLRQKKVNTNPA